MQVGLISLLDGLVYGMLLFMLASGLTLILSMMGVLNFAHASVYMLGAYFAYQIDQWVGFWPALVIAPLLCGAIGAAIEVWGLRRVHHNGHIAELLFTFGLVFIIGRGVQMIWGMLPMAYRVPAGLDFPLFSLYGENFPAYRGFMLLVSGGMLLTPDIVARLAAFEANDQSEENYEIPAGLKLRDEIARYYRIGEALWSRFEATRGESVATSERFVLDLLRQCFGFDSIESRSITRLGEREISSPPRSSRRTCADRHRAGTGRWRAPLRRG